MKILSLFDGMACGMIAMLNAGIEVESYDAYEIDKYAIKVSSHNFPNINHHGDVFEADFTQYEGVDFLVGGSPCTYWSIAQKNNRETEASGMGWELFSQYVRAVKEAKPKFFIYENNKSMSAAIRESIDNAFGFEAVHINSALVSAQNRQRLYWIGMRNKDGTYSKVPVEQPVDRGIILRDILEPCVAEQAYEMRTVGVGYRNRREDDGKLYRRFETHGEEKANALTTVLTDSMVAEPIRVGHINSGGQGDRIYDARGKACAVTANGGGAGGSGGGLYAEPVRIGDIGSTAQAHRVYSCDGKSVTINAGGGGQGGKTGLYLCPVVEDNVLSDEYYHGGFKSNLIGMVETPMTGRNGKQPSQHCRVYSCDDKAMCLGTDSRNRVIAPSDGKTTPVYEVRNGLITIKGKQYPIKLADGFYIIRKLTVTECMRLQTVPEWYDFSVISDCQAYKCLGNGWTCDVITHLINAAQTAGRRRWLADLLGDCL